jgi:transposase-like protein
VDPEVSATARRRRFTAEYKRGILEEADRCGPGQVGALLRREGLYSSHLTTWRKQREAALRSGLAPRKRGRKPQYNPLAERVAELERDNARLRGDLEKAEIIIEVQKKVATLLRKTEKDGANE